MPNVVSLDDLFSPFPSAFLRLLRSPNAVRHGLHWQLSGSSPQP